MRRLRILFPLCNILIDVTLLSATIYAVNAHRSTLRNPWPLWEQRYERVDPDFLRNADGPAMPAPLQAMNLGTPPAAIAAALLAEALFTNGSLSWKVSSPFDFRLVGLHLCLAMAFWYAVGRRLETSQPRWITLTWVYLVVRLLTIPVSLMLRANDWWMLVFLLFSLAWIILAAILAIKSLRRLWIRHTSATA